MNKLEQELERKFNDLFKENDLKNVLDIYCTILEEVKAANPINMNTNSDFKGCSVIIKVRDSLFIHDPCCTDTSKLIRVINIADGKKYGFLSIDTIFSIHHIPFSDLQIITTLITNEDNPDYTEALSIARQYIN